MRDRVLVVDDEPGMALGIAETLRRRGFDADTAASFGYVLIKIEQAEIAFRTMMEVRNKLVEAYHEVMRMGV